MFLTELRNKHELTVEELAARLGFVAYQLNELETGDANNFKHADRLCAALVHESPKDFPSIKLAKDTFNLRCDIQRALHDNAKEAYVTAYESFNRGLRYNVGQVSDAQLEAILSPLVALIKEYV